MTKCECGCENNGNCTNAKYYEQEHNGYDLLKESRLYYSNKARQENVCRTCSYQQECLLENKNDFSHQVDRIIEEK